MKVSQITAGILGLLWLVAITIGLPALMKYEYTPGKAATAPNSWPKDSQIQLASDRDTLIMLAHPQCPCTKASINELAQLMSKDGSKLKAYVLFLSPKSVPPDWDRKDLWQSAQAIPNVIVQNDIEGIEASRFNSVTSGQTLVYNPSGELLFNGGITKARGQAGDNLGREFIIKILNGKPAASQLSMVFGCPLINPQKK